MGWGTRHEWWNNSSLIVNGLYFGGSGSGLQFGLGWWLVGSNLGQGMVLQRLLSWGEHGCSDLRKGIEWQQWLGGRQRLGAGSIAGDSEHSSSHDWEGNKVVLRVGGCGQQKNPEKNKESKIRNKGKKRKVRFGFIMIRTPWPKSGFWSKCYRIYSKINV